MQRRKLTVRIAAVSLTVGAIVGTAASTQATQPTQVVRGLILVPTGPRTAGPVWLGACGGVLGGTAHFVARADWAFGRRFTVNPNTYGKRFTLRPALPADLDISFFRRGTDRYFERRNLTGESGVVPDGATTAAICLVGGPPTEFRYAAG